MSVVVKGMRMPENCIKCPMQFGGWCYVAPPEIDERVAPTVDEAWEQGKPEWCPLIALPDKHGRLVDADATIKEIKARNPYDVSYEDAWAITCIEHASTIVESEGET